MRRAVLTAALLVGAVVVALWLGGGLDGLAAWAAEGQRRFQNAMAGALRRLRGGEAGALLALLGICFAYGFFHAAGPGHGKVLIGGYGVGSRVPVPTLAGIALAASLAQATTAVALVYAGVLVFDWSRERMTGVTEAVMAPVSYGAIGLIGLWLVWRGFRGLLRRTRRASVTEAQASATGDAHGTCAGCGHRHGPTPDDIARLRSPRDAALLIGGIALRPCTGALFVLILTWRMGIAGAGIAGTYAMALGTASVTVGVAVLSVLAREGALVNLPGGGAVRAAVPVLELVAGGTVVAVAATLLMRAL